MVLILRRGSPIIDGIFLVQKMCIYSCVMIITTVLIMHGPVQWCSQLVMHHVYIMYIYFPKVGSKYLNCKHSPEEIVQKLNKYTGKHKINTPKILLNCKPLFWAKTTLKMGQNSQSFSIVLLNFLL